MGILRIKMVKDINAIDPVEPITIPTILIHKQDVFMQMRIHPVVATTVGCGT